MKSLIPSNLITAEDRSFLHNWDKTISSTLDVITKQAVEKKIVRHEKSCKFTSSHSSNPSSSSVASPPPSSSPPPSPAQSTSPSPSPTRKLKRGRLTGTTLEVPPDILSIVAPVSDLFKVLRKTWDSLDLQNIQLPDRIPAVYRGHRRRRWRRWLSSWCLSTWRRGSQQQSWSSTSEPTPSNQSTSSKYPRTFNEGLPKETRDLIAAKIGNLDV